MNWPPKAWDYDVPISYDIDVWDLFMDSIKMSIRSMGDTALYVVIIFIAFSVVLIIIKKFTKVNASESPIEKGVARRKLSREIFEADFNQNLSSIIEDKILHKKVDLKANLKFFQTNKDLLVDDSTRRMDVSHFAKKAFHRKHKDWLVQDRIDGMEVGHLSKKAFHKKHKDWLVQEKVNSMEVSMLAEKQFHEKFPDAYGDKKELYKENAKRYYEKRKGKK